MGLSAIKINLHESAKAFRLNGVTFAKSKLCELFPAWGATQESFYRFLIIAPFFAETKEPGSAPTETGNYAIAKSKRLMDAIDMPHDAIPAFMEVAAELGKLPYERASEITDQLHDHVCSCGQKHGQKIKTREGKTVH